MKFIKEELVKSPLNYTGGKFKLLPQILPYFPDDINTFVDLFGGGFNVGVNVKANRVIYNDIEPHVVGLLKYFKNNNLYAILDMIDKYIEYYGLSQTSKYGYEYYGCNSSKGVADYNKDKYFRLREDYNKDTTNDLLFFMVIIFAFSNQIQFNSQGKFNMSVNKRDFNKSMRNNTKRFISKLHDIEVYFFNENFKSLQLDSLTPNDFVYCDPPYLIGHATYNEKNGWNNSMENNLLSLLDELNKKGIKFALSNVFENKGKSNDILKEWSKKYNVIHLNNSYGNCNYHTKDKSSNSTDEVLIINY